MVSYPSLLLLHGALGSAAQFDALRPALAESFSTHAFDFEGHGQQPAMRKRGEFRIESFAQQTLDWLDSQKIATIDIFGYSMGGYVALYLAHTQPERVGRIMTLGTKTLWTRESAVQEMGQLDAETVEQKVPHFVRLLVARHWMPWQMMLGHTRDMIQALGERNLLHEVVLAGIDHPIRVAVGDRDSTVPVEEGAAVARALRSGELEVFPRTPHPLEKVRLDRLIRSLTEFFAEE